MLYKGFCNFFFSVQDQHLILNIDRPVRVRSLFTLPTGYWPLILVRCEGFNDIIFWIRVTLSDQDINLILYMDWSGSEVRCVLHQMLSDLSGRCEDFPDISCCQSVTFSVQDMQIILLMKQKDLKNIYLHTASWPLVFFQLESQVLVY